MGLRWDQDVIFARRRRLERAESSDYRRVERIDGIALVVLAGTCCNFRTRFIARTHHPANSTNEQLDPVYAARPDFQPYEP